MTSTPDPHVPELAISMPKTGDTEVALEVELSAERPAATMHGLQPNRASRGLAIAAAGGGVLALIIALVAGGGGDDEAVPKLQPQLRSSLDATVAVVEGVRTDAITVAYTRSLAEAPVARRGKPRGNAAEPSTPAPVRTTPPTTEPATHASTSSGATHSSSKPHPGSVIQSLPAAPAADTPTPEPTAAEPAAPPAEPAAEAPAEPAADPKGAPLPGVGDPEDDAPVEDDAPPMPS